MYAEAERTLSAAEALYRYNMFQRDDAAVPALTKIEAEQRAARVAAGAKLALNLENAMTSVEADPGRRVVQRLEPRPGAGGHPAGPCRPTDAGSSRALSPGVGA